MPRVDLTLETNIERTARVIQLEGLFDVPSAQKTRVEFHFDVPLEEKSWNVGLIVGPSGAGKSSVARHLFKDAMVNGYDWHTSRSVVDSFGDMPIRDTTAALSSVGFSSPPNWLRPFHVLSNGEQFRATMARALVDPRQLVCIDEFTSVVDRTAAQIGSHAIQKSVRAKGKQLVAVTCHYDVSEWLQPDWVLEPHLGRFAWRSLQRRPAIELSIRRVTSAYWELFKRHHYLTSDINRSATCFVAFWNGEPAAFDAWLPFVGKLKDSRKGRRGHRTVCLPDYQGVGIGNALFTHIAAMWKGLGYRAFSCTGHPAELYKRARSPDWNMTRNVGRTHRDTGALLGKRTAQRMASGRAFNRNTASFEYVGRGLDPELARRLIGC